ncbi:hypothetical protein [Saccharopolyspora shandongensis]|nr:hypothetical protein [Saccharopolyspora shandongensis]
MRNVGPWTITAPLSLPGSGSAWSESLAERQPLPGWRRAWEEIMGGGFPRTLDRAACARPFPG